MYSLNIYKFIIFIVVFVIFNITCSQNSGIVDSIFLRNIFKFSISSFSQIKPSNFATGLRL